MAERNLIEGTMMVRLACRFRQENLFKSGQETDNRVVKELNNAGMWNQNKLKETLVEIQKEIDYPTMINFKGGVAKVTNNPDLEQTLAQCEFLNKDEYVNQIRTVKGFMNNGTTNEILGKRLQDLQGKYKAYCFEYAAYETRVMDQGYLAKGFELYKVDTHIHGGAVCSQPMLIKYLRRQLRDNANEIIAYRQGVPVKLKQVFQESGIERAGDLKRSTLKMSAEVNEENYIPISFNVFNSKFIPCQKPELKKHFLNINNLNDGRKFAGILLEAGDEAEIRKEVLEVRITLKGSHPEELKLLANWAVTNNVFHKHIRYLIQIPRTFHLMDSVNVKSFEDMMKNIFTHAIYASYNPEILKNVAIFLDHIVGIDLVDDEGGPEFQLTEVDYASPEHLGAGSRIPYTYFLYYIYRNLCVLNRVRKYCLDHEKNVIHKGDEEKEIVLRMRPIKLRPHCGECGSVDHLVGAFLLVENVNHGRMLKEAGNTLIYLYYINQVGLSFSLISNHCLYERYELTPFKRFLEVGLRLALTTDDRTIFHRTEDPLSEEFQMAKERLGITNPEITELYRNSIIISGLAFEEKERLLGRKFQEDDFEGNDERRTSVPSPRIRIRAQSLLEELDFVFTGDVGRFK